MLFKVLIALTRSESFFQLQVLYKCITGWIKCIFINILFFVKESPELKQNITDSSEDKDAIALLQKVSKKLEKTHEVVSKLEGSSRPRMDVRKSFSGSLHHTLRKASSDENGRPSSMIVEVSH